MVFRCGFASTTKPRVLAALASGGRLKYLIFILNCFALVTCSTVPKEDVIPRSWMLEEITMQDYFDDDYSLCENLSERVNINCVRGSGNPFKHKLSLGYKVYRYSTPKERWKSFSGHEGIALEIGGIIVETKTTTVQ